MYCILVTGIPASGKSTFAKYLSKSLEIPVISKDTLKEILFDTVGFDSRDEKITLGIAAMETMYHFAKQLISVNQPFILENNFENTSKQGLDSLLLKYNCVAITICLTGEYDKIFERFLKRDTTISRHRGHVVNDCYPEKGDTSNVPISYTFDSFARAINERGMVEFMANGPKIQVDTTDFEKIDYDCILEQVKKTIFDIQSQN